VTTVADLTDDQRVVYDLVIKDALELIKSYAKRATIGFLLLLVGLGFAINGNTQALNDSRSRGQKVRTVICTVLTQSDQETYILAEKGQISAAELQNALKATATYREEVGPAPGCTNTITPPPRGLK
jgi:hypothetical protein